MIDSHPSPAIDNSWIDVFGIETMESLYSLYSEMKHLLTCCVLLGAGYLACTNAPEYPDEPELTFIGLSNESMAQGDLQQDSTILFFEFTDGDGNLGDRDSINVFGIDLRDNFVAGRFRIPFIPIPGANNGISGELQLTLYTTCCVFPNGQPPCTPSEDFPTDQVEYEFYIVDRAGNESNRVRTGPIILRCE